MLSSRDSCVQKSTPQILAKKQTPPKILIFRLVTPSIKVVRNRIRKTRNILAAGRWGQNWVRPRERRRNCAIEYRRVPVWFHTMLRRAAITPCRAVKFDGGRWRCLHTDGRDDGYASPGRTSARGGAVAARLNGQRLSPLIPLLSIIIFRATRGMPRLWVD